MVSFTENKKSVFISYFSGDFPSFANFAVFQSVSLRKKYALLKIDKLPAVSKVVVLQAAISPDFAQKVSGFYFRLW